MYWGYSKSDTGMFYLSTEKEKKSTGNNEQNSSIEMNERIV